MADVTQSDDWMLVGRVAGALGILGEVKVNLETDFPNRFKKTKRIFVGEEHREMVVASARRHGDRVALRFADIGDRDAAAALAGQPLYLPRAEAVPLPEGHYYHDQIKGLQAITTDGQALGSIVDILTTGSNDVYIASDGTKEILIPAIKDVVRAIDLDAGTLLVEPVDGLL